jgi:hypothetical protein
MRRIPEESSSFAGAATSLSPWQQQKDSVIDININID